MENNISQAAFNQKLFFSEKEDILQLLFREWCESNGVEFDTNCMGVLMTATLQPSATTLVIWLTVWVEQDVTRMSKLLSSYRSFLLQLVVVSKMFQVLLQDFED